jgi:hypothetical protein
MNNQIVILLLGMLSVAMLLGGSALAQAKEWMECEIAWMERQIGEGRK